MGYNASRATRRAWKIEKLLQSLLILASLYIFVNYHVLSPEVSQELFEPRQGRPKDSKLAFATLLLPWGDEGLEENDYDLYFRSTRLLNYQLQHSKYTRNRPGVPLLVLVTPDVAQWKRDKLENEGATIVVVERLTSNWLQPMAERWKDMMAKLRLWELTQYDRILFLDSDTFLLKPIEGIFDDPAAGAQSSLNNTAEIKTDELSLPQTYVFASHPEVLHTDHPYPPINMPYFNAGFFLMSPCLEMFSYLTHLLDLPERFNSNYMEQNLLNYAHREHGNMPWQRVHHKWNVNLPNMNDVRQGVVSVHAKLWSPGNVLQPTERELMDKWEGARLEMERHYKFVGKGKNFSKENLKG